MLLSNATPEDVLFASLNGLIELATQHAKEGNTEKAKEIADYVQEKLDNLREN